MKPDESALLAQLAAISSPPGPSAVHVLPREVYKAMGIHWKRACYLLAKWAEKGWYEYGVSIDTGWLTDAGRDAARKAGG